MGALHQALLATKGAGGGGPVDTFPSQSDLQLRTAAFLQTGYADLATMSQWDDLSGNARHLPQASGPIQPIYHASGGPNNQAYVAFDHTAGTGGSRFNVPNFLTGYTAGELFMLLKIPADPPASLQGSHSFWGSDTANDNHYPYNGDSNVYCGWGTTARKSVGNPTPSLANWHLLNIRSASGAWSFHINGTSWEFGPVANTVGFYTAAFVGASRNLGFTCSIAELAFFSVIRSGGERSAIHSYFSNPSLYNLTIV